MSRANEPTGEAVAWQYHVRRPNGEWSKWTDWPNEDRPELIGSWKVEYRPLYTQPAASDAVVDDPCRRELENIANARRFDRGAFRDDTEFADWAQNRARHAAALAPGQENDNGK